MDARVAVPLGLAVVAVGAVALVAAGGGIGGLLTTDGYQPVTPSPTPTATGGNGGSAGAGTGTTDGGEATGTGAVRGTAETGTGTETETGTPTPPPTFGDGYERATVTVRDANGTRLGRLRVALAETYRQKYTGLSETERLPESRGMLFVYDEPGNHTYVMRGMSFGIDIVYVGADGTITSVHHAPEPPEGADGESYRYPGYGQYVLEVNLGWTTRHGVEPGDRIVIDRDGNQAPA